MKKILSVLICIFLLLPTVGCSDQSPEKYEKQKALYDDIVSQYTSLLSSKQKGEALSAPDTTGMSQREIDISETLFGIVDTLNDALSPENLGYGYKDLDGNGSPELILLNKYFYIKAIFTISHSKPILLESNYDGSFLFTTKNRFLMSRRNVNGSIEETTFYTCHVSDKKMVYDSVYGSVYDQDKKETLEMFQIVDGKRTSIDEDTFDALYREYRRTTVPGYTDTYKLYAPRIHFPLNDSITNENLPLADFSSYEAIRETYSKISACLDNFESQRWCLGEYDNLFAFPNDRSFEYYTRLLYAAYNGAYNIGYDEIDLNGDGKDELVLMNEDYRIKAIFTQRKGIPILLDAFAYETCWLDDKGFIHVDNEQYDKLEYSLYEFTRTGKYNLVYSLLLDGGYYLIKDGKSEEITPESKKPFGAYYDDYCRYSEPFEPHEQTRNVSKLTYTPLESPKDDIINAATEKIWHKYAKLEKTSGKDHGRSNTYVTFENVSDTQMTISVKYKFTFSYPDPNNDHSLLDEATESTLKINARNEGGVLVFEENGIKGKLEFGHDCLWIIIDESTDQRLPIGHHCYEQYSPEDLIS